MQSILITGANGFVGSHLVNLLAKYPFKITATGRTEASAAQFRPEVAYQQMDFTNEQEVTTVFSAVRPALVVHCGAMSKPDDCELQKERAITTNVDGTKTLLAEAKQYKAHFIFLSTDFVFSGEEGMYKEDDERAPVNFYGQTKVEAEDVVMNYPFDWAIARTVLVYGRSVNGKATFIENIVAAAQRNEQLRIFNDQVRTPTYVGDLVQGILLIIQKNATGAFHLSGKDRITVFDFARKAVAWNKLDEGLLTPICEGDLTAPARRPKLTGFNLTKAKTLLCYEPVGLEEGLRLTFSPNVT